MFLGLAVAAILAILLTVLAIRLVRAVFRFLTKGADDEKKPDNERKKNRKPKDESLQSTLEEESVREVKEPELEIPEESRSRYDASVLEGITEGFSSEQTDFIIDGKRIAESCTAGSGLTYLEFNNRHLAAEDFRGFNLIIEQDSRMVLTYGGSAVASITKIERVATAIINGETVTGTMPGYRVNTFPPRLRPGMAVSDIEAMLHASDSIKSLSGDPDAVCREMIKHLTQPENVARLKREVDSKIQAKESKMKDMSALKTKRKPMKMS